MQRYKKIILKLKEMRGQSGEAAFDRTTEMLELFVDREFRLDTGYDDHAAGDFLDELADDLCVKFLQLKELIGFYPSRSQWKDGKLGSMYRHMKEAREKVAKEQRDALGLTKPKTGGGNGAATLREVEVRPTEKLVAELRSDLIQQKQVADNEIGYWKRECEKAQKELAQLRAEKKEWDAERKKLNRRIVELERGTAVAA